MLSIWGADPDLPGHRVHVQSGESRETLAAALAQAGYAPA